jgi:hypothetical protein
MNTQPGGAQEGVASAYVPEPAESWPSDQPRLAKAWWLPLIPSAALLGFVAGVIVGVIVALIVVATTCDMACAPADPYPKVGFWSGFLATFVLVQVGLYAAAWRTRRRPGIAKSVIVVATAIAALCAWWLYSLYAL